MRTLRHFLHDEAGGTAIEYSLIATLVAIAIVASVTSLGSNLSATWGTVATVMPAGGP